MKQPFPNVLLYNKKSYLQTVHSFVLLAQPQESNEPKTTTTVGRGKMLSMLQSQPLPPSKEVAPSEISSTEDALAQMRLKHREESSKSSETKAPTIQQLEAEASHLDEDVQEEVLQPQTGTNGKPIPNVIN